MLLDKFHNKFIVKGILVAQTPIHIGAGEEGFDPIQADNAVIRDSMETLIFLAVHLKVYYGVMWKRY